MTDVGNATNAGKNLFAILDQEDEFQTEALLGSPCVKE